MISPGVKYILIAGFVFGIINTLVKYYAHIPAIEIVFFRSLVSFILSFYMVKKLELKVFNKHSKILFLRGVCGAIALSLYFYTIQVIPLASAVSILYLAPVFTVILAIYLVKERPHKMQWPYIFLSLTGAVFIKGFDLRISLTHFFMGVIAAVFAGLAYNYIRMLKGKVHHQLIIFYFPMVTLPFCIPIMIPNWTTPNLSDLLGLLFIGVLTQVAQVYMTKAYLADKASKISHFNYLTSIYALAAGYFFFDEVLQPSGILGITMIIFGVTMSSRYANKS